MSGSVDRNEVRGTRVIPGLSPKLGDLLNEAHDEMSPESLGKPAERLLAQGRNTRRGETNVGLALLGS